MKTRLIYFLSLAVMVILLPVAAEAQRMSHGSRGGGARSAPSMSRPSQPSRNVQQTRPQTQQRQQPQTRPAQQPNRSINGGQQKSSDRNLNTKAPSRDAKPATRETKAPGRDVNSPARDYNKSNIKNNQPASRDRNTNINRGGNTVNVNRNVNVYHRAPTYVRPPVRP